VAYGAILLIVVAWVAANDGAYRELQASYDVKSEMLDALKRRGSTHLGTSTPGSANLDAASIAASSETVAASTLQRHLLDRLENAGGLVLSIQAEPKRETISPGLQRLGAQLAFDASQAALQRFLFDLETGLPFVFVDSLAVQPAAAAQGARAGDRLRVTLYVSSYWKAGEPAGASR
jgi:general secretion pathway protein M